MGAVLEEVCLHSKVLQRLLDPDSPLSLQQRTTLRVGLAVGFSVLFVTVAVCAAADYRKHGRICFGVWPGTCKTSGLLCPPRNAPANTHADTENSNEDEGPVESQDVERRLGDVPS